MKIVQSFSKFASNISFISQHSCKFTIKITVKITFFTIKNSFLKLFCIIVFRAHKSYTHRTRLERLRQAYSEELSVQPLVYQQEEKVEAPFIPPRRVSVHDDYFSPDDRFLNKTTLHMPPYVSAENQLKLRQLRRDEFQKVRYFNPESHFHDPYQRYSNYESHIYQNHQPNELEEVFMQRVINRKKSAPPPPAPPPPPIMPSASQPNSAASSRANTLQKKNIPRPPWDMEEVLQRSTELKFKRDQKSSHNDLATKLNTAEKAANSKNQAKTVAEIISQNQEVIDMSEDFRANDRTLPRGTKKVQPSILSPLSASLSRSTKNRFASIANRFEHQKGYDRHPASYGTHGSGVSAYVDNIFEPVFADEDEELFQNRKLLVSYDNLKRLFL